MHNRPLLASDDAPATASRGHEAVRQLIDGHITDAERPALMHTARETAEQVRMCLLLYFPNDAGNDLMPVSFCGSKDE